ncbi:hypothetical protein AVEN_4638-1 [Araneus ventricosus]|uniref:Uncharacterized protein n=1 Tax=Araneus ventricosus TaxID=182803 RepID=A0A4Y2LL71_ARAVE|nr:hypothetical protein AVEN_4638-1 [Araneus ventricosus]
MRSSQRGDPSKSVQFADNPSLQLRKWAHPDNQDGCIGSDAKVTEDYQNSARADGRGSKCGTALYLNTSMAVPKSSPKIRRCRHQVNKKLTRIAW